MSNTERQRQFRERNPGYYGRLHARRRAEAKAHLEAQRVAAMAKRREPLALPAPVERIEIPGMTIPAIAAIPALAPLIVSEMKPEDVKQDYVGNTPPRVGVASGFTSSRFTSR